MKSKKIYYRRKKKKIVIEGKRKNKTIYIFQLPSAERLLRLFIDINLGDPNYMKNPSFLTKEKIEKIKTIFESLDYKKNKNENYG